MIKGIPLKGHAINDYAKETLYVIPVKPVPKKPVPMKMGIGERESHSHESGKPDKIIILDSFVSLGMTELIHRFSVEKVN